MNIEMTDAIRKEIIKQVTDRLVGEVRKQIDATRIVSEVRTAVRAELTSKIAGDFHRSLNTSDMVNTAMREAEQRINRRIEQTIQRGVTLNIRLGE